MVKEFQQFLFRGNLIELAVAFVMGAAFNSVVLALVKDLITPLIAAIFGKPNFSSIHFTLHHALFPVGDFINAVVSLLLTALAVFYFVVTPVNLLTKRLTKPQAAPTPTTKECPECCSQIPIGAKRCMNCTVVLP